MRSLKQIQSKESLGDLSRFPEKLKGELAKDNWHNGVFRLGMEYGYILALTDLESEEHDRSIPVYHPDRDWETTKIP